MPLTPSTSTVQMQAVDPEGTAITYGIVDKNSHKCKACTIRADTTINQTTGIYIYTHYNSCVNAGSFKARLSATDGVTTSTTDRCESCLYHTLDWLVIAGGGGGGSSLPVYELEAVGCWRLSLLLE